MSEPTAVFAILAHFCCRQPRKAGAALFSVLICLWIGADPAHACRYQRGLFLQVVESWKTACPHPLCGTVFATGPKQPQSKDSCDGDPYVAFRREASDALRRGGFVLLGETHDNAEHHRLRGAWLSDELATAPDRARRSRPAAAFEHIRQDQQQGLALFADMSRNGQHLASTANLFRFLKWETSGWPDQSKFQPLFAAVIKNRLTIVPADPSRESVRAITKGGMQALPDAQRKRLGLHVPLDPPLRDALLDELEASHCGLVAKEKFATMADAQRFRDAHQASAIAGATGNGGAVLFAGNGHVRSDRGVPHYLKALAPGKPVVSVILVEVEAGKTQAEVYMPRSSTGKPAADFLIFTPRVERKDPCIEMREQFSKMKK